MDAINLTRHDFHGEWNYTVSPKASICSDSSRTGPNAPKRQSKARAGASLPRRHDRDLSPAAFAAYLAHAGFDPGSTWADRPPTNPSTTSGPRWTESRGAYLSIERTASGLVLERARRGDRTPRGRGAIAQQGQGSVQGGLFGLDGQPRSRAVTGTQARQTIIVASGPTCALAGNPRRAST